MDRRLSNPKKFQKVLLRHDSKEKIYKNTIFEEQSAHQTVFCSKKKLRHVIPLLHTTTDKSGPRTLESPIDNFRGNDWMHNTFDGLS